MKGEGAPPLIVNFVPVELVEKRVLNGAHEAAHMMAVYGAVIVELPDILITIPGDAHLLPVSR
jgi:hypothetical protein